MLNSLESFRQAVDQLEDLHDAYWIFEEDCTEQLVATIYSYADPDAIEPFRSAMHALGYVNY